MFFVRILCEFELTSNNEIYFLPLYFCHPFYWNQTWFWCKLEYTQLPGHKYFPTNATCKPIVMPFCILKLTSLRYQHLIICDRNPALHLPGTRIMPLIYKIYVIHLNVANIPIPVLAAHSQVHLILAWPSISQINPKSLPSSKCTSEPFFFCILLTIFSWTPDLMSIYLTSSLWCPSPASSLMALTTWQDVVMVYGTCTTIVV